MLYIGIFLAFCAIAVYVVLKSKQSVSTITGGRTSYQKSGDTEIYSTERFVEIKTALGDKKYYIIIDSRGVNVNGKQLKD